jgi:hypothetical protein
MLFRADLAIVISDGMGHASIISSNARSALNEYGEKKIIDHPEKD